MTLFAKKHGFEEQMVAEHVRLLLESYLDKALYAEIHSVRLSGKTLEIKILSPLLKHDFTMRKTFFLTKFQEELGATHFTSLRIL